MTTLTTPAPHLSTSPTGRPHLGPRTVITAALWPELERAVDHARGSVDRSPFLADLLAWHVGRQDLIRHRQLALALDSCAASTADSTLTIASTRHCTVRVHPDVANELVTRAEANHRARGVYNARVIAELLGAAVPRLSSSTQEGLPLAM